MITAPALDYSRVDPALWWFLAVILSALIASFIAYAVAVNRNLDSSPPGLIPPVPQAREFDPELSSADRARELAWMERLMVEPAAGEGRRLGERPPG